MCGIAGIITTRTLEPAKLERALVAMNHRGPDAGGAIKRGKASLLFRRLKIVDLSPRGNQPMSNEDGTVWIVFNGEIYNFQALRRELEIKHRFSSQTDTEVLIHGYEEWGLDGLLKRIEGMYAFAIWDEKKEELFVARDRIGKKPLFYTELPGGEFAFASTLNSLLELLPNKPGIDLKALDQYLVYQAVPAPQTIYQGIYALLPAHSGILRPGRPFQTSRYWKLSYQNKQYRKEPDLIEELDSHLTTAVESRLISDVPLGAFLSGGVDSSLVVGIMAKLRSEPVKTLTMGFDNPKFDERVYARQVSQRWKTEAHEAVLQPNEIDNLPAIIWHYGQPMADVSIIPTFAVSRFARQHVTVVLNGDGGDEGFSGYSRPMVARAAQLCRERVPGPFQGPFRSMLSLAGKRGHLLSSALESDGRGAFVYERGFRTCREELYDPTFYRGVAQTGPDASYADAWDRADGPTDADRVLSAEFETYLPNQLLTKMDISTMGNSIEARSPLLDTSLLEFAATIPVEQLTKGWQTKYLLKRVAERYVPREVLYRRKQGFVMPASTWIREDLALTVRSLMLSLTEPDRGLFQREWVMKILNEHMIEKKDWGQQIWTLMVFEIWYRLFIEQSLAPETRLSDIDMPSPRSAAISLAA